MSLVNKMRWRRRWTLMLSRARYSHKLIFNALNRTLKFNQILNAINFISFKSLSVDVVMKYSVSFEFWQSLSILINQDSFRSMEVLITMLFRLVCERQGLGWDLLFHFPVLCSYKTCQWRWQATIAGTCAITKLCSQKIFSYIERNEGQVFKKPVVF